MKLINNFIFAFTIAFLFVVIIGMIFVYPFDKSEKSDINFLPLHKKQDVPKIVRAIYLTSSSGGNRAKIENIIKLKQDSKINAVVIDIKDFSGRIAYSTSVEEAKKYGAAGRRIPDIDALIGKLHDKEIYIIARMVIFQDQILAGARPEWAVKSAGKISAGLADTIWRDRNGLAWADPSIPEVWDYNIKIAREAVELGFDEINFDYIRFPTDGKLSDIIYPAWDGKTSKPYVIKEFYKKLRQELPDAKLSADLFGFSTFKIKDFGIGQIIEDAFEYFDYISPMLYPSHYPVGFLGFKNPAEHPYEVVEFSMENAMKRLRDYNLKNKKEVAIRPWLQDFDLGANYTADMVRAQIRAVQDTTGDDFSGFMLWNASNVYTHEALD